jgi:hypothetical protein
VTTDFGACLVAKSADYTAPNVTNPKKSQSKPFAALLRVAIA